jgi:Carboxypeptidase regulatory-like domain
MQSPRRLILVGMTAIFVCVHPAISRAQEPPPPPPQAPPPAQTQPPDKLLKQSYSHANDFLILGTIFDPKGYAFPGVQLKIRRSKEKKFRWDTFTNSRGEFAIRVPQGTDYLMVVHVKGFADQTRELDAKTGVSEARIVFRMESLAGEKK